MIFWALVIALQRQNCRYHTQQHLFVFFLLAIFLMDRCEETAVFVVCTLKKAKSCRFFLDFSMTMLATFCQRASNHSPHVLKLYIQYIKFFPPNLLIQKSFYPVSKATAFQSFDEQHNQYKQKKRMLLRKIVCQNGLLNHQS